MAHSDLDGVFRKTKRTHYRNYSIVFSAVGLKELPVYLHSSSKPYFKALLYYETEKVTRCSVLGTGKSVLSSVVEYLSHMLESSSTV